MANITHALRDEILTRYRLGDGYRLIARELGLTWEVVRDVIREYLVGQSRLA